MKRLWRIPWLVALAFGFSLVVTIVANLFILQREIENFQNTAQQTTLTNTIAISQSIDREAKQRAWATVQTRLRRLNGQPTAAHYQIIAANGHVLADSQQIHPTGRLDLSLLAPVLAGKIILTASVDSPYRVQVALPLPDQSGQPAAILLSITNWETQLTQVQNQTLTAIGIAILAATAVSSLTLALLWKWVVSPLERLRQVAEAVTKGVEEARAPAFRVAELDQVSTAFNQMLARNVAQQAQLTQINQQLQNANVELSEQAETVGTINRIGRLVSAETDLQKLVQSVTDATTALSGAEFGAFFYNVVNERRESYQLYTLSGVPQAAFAQFTMPRNTALFAHTFQGKGVIRLADVRQDARYGQNAPYYGMPPGHLPVTSYLAVPVVSRSGQTIGGLFFGHSQAGVFTERAEQIVVGLAAQAAIALDNAYLFEAAQREIAERKQAEMQIKASLREKEALLKEIHHRVKNNLQVISSLLFLQSNQIKEPQVLEIFQESQNRIKSMALIHEKLYQAPDLALIDFAAYVQNLAAHLFRSYSVKAAPIQLRIRVLDIAMGLDSAIPCGLIINELMSNSLKYAFAPDQPGEIWVELDLNDSQQLTLTVGDNGSGLPPEVDFRQTQSLGLQLVNMLTEQLNGVIELDRRSGATFKITFRA